MPRKTRKILATGEALTKKDLAKFLRTEGASINAEEAKSLSPLAKWFINSNIKQLSDRVDMSDNDIIRVLGKINRPGPQREVIKAWLVTRLFEKVPRSKDNDKAHLFAARIKDQSDLSGAQLLLASDEAATGVHANRALLEAAQYFSAGDVHKAFVKYDEMRRALRAGEFIGPHTQGVLSIRSLEEFSKAIDDAKTQKSPRDPITFPAGHFAEKKPIVVIGVDPVYHDRYAARMVETANGVVNIHFHVCNPGSMALIAADNVRYSFESNPNASAPFYASMRFLSLRQILQTYQAPVMTLDADSAMRGEVPLLFSMMDEFDVALNTSRDARGVLPWRYINAQVVGANPCDAAFGFLSNFEAQFDHLMAQDGSVNWYVDQALLTTTLLLTKERTPEARIMVRGLSKMSGTRQSKV
jgi:hypothetical protein